MVLTTATAGAILGVVGCAKPLFPANADRSQFDRYMRVRERSPAPYLEDEFGRRTPNLRGRLLSGN